MYIKEIIFDTGNNITADMHTHSEHSGDSECPIMDMAEAQKRAGTAIFAVTDHCNIEWHETMDVEAMMRASVADTVKASEAVRGVQILRGIEIGEAFWNDSVANGIISLEAYDVVVGSVHSVKFEEYTNPYSEIDFEKLGREKAKKYFSMYLDDLLYTAENTDFDILAHLTCPLRYMNGKYGLFIDCREYYDKIEKILAAIIKRGIALEINTSCKGSAYDEFMPEEWIVALYKSMGGELVALGSDAHKSANASYFFNDAKDMLKRNGFNKLCYFRKRKLYMYSI